MRVMTWIAGAAIALVAVSPVQARKAELVDPAPVAVPAGVDQSELVKDIKRALIGRGWAVTGEAPGQVDSTLTLREHVAKIRVTFDAREVKFAYVDSTNLDYRQKNGKAFIHSNYLGWMQYLTDDLTTNLQVSASE